MTEYGCLVLAGPHDIYRVADAVGSRHAYKARHSRRTPPRPRFARFRTASFKSLRRQFLVYSLFCDEREDARQPPCNKTERPNDECRTWQALRYYSPRSLIVKTDRSRMRGGERENCCFRKARVRCFFPVGPRGRLVIMDCYCCACFLHLTPRKLGIPMRSFVLMGPSTYFLRSFLS